MQSLAQVSTLLVYAAIAAFVGAMLAFAVDVSGRPGNRGEGVRRPGAGIGMSLTYLGTIFLGIGVVTRGIAGGHMPWSNMYEFTISFTFVALVIFLILSRRWDLRDVGVFVALPAALILGLAVVVLYTRSDGIAPILDHYWLIIHVPLAIGGVGVFGIAAFIAALQLGKDVAGEDHGLASRILGVLPPVKTLEQLAHRLVAVGFVLWTFTIVAGAIWANSAWTRPWGWDAKEVMSFVVWVIYAAYLHARTTRGWDGRRSAYLILIGFAGVMFNMFGINYFFESKHSYALIEPAITQLLL
ncbi:cytochrome c-type biogenesis protein CcsB [Bowdeniella nasicola]|uniref:Cytochrome c-type biogenesis protein CcsB n=1 Tax=Bowdeniella nasicola TaxID=208480 RepID=A0A1H3XBB4_9ACTO|nr:MULTISPECIES: c-type cytochrome biogenesis protein CcsB [Bowdeniella]SDZ95838.1 cytochrome c-type biogenesis protein CcsB [Bowdeniella nasicola]